MAQAKIGIIGGSGLYKMDVLQDLEEVQVDTPFGPPSDSIILGTLSGTRVAFLARHGRNHHLLPSELPFRANIYAMKSLGVEYLISASAVGSLKEEVKPMDMVLPDQYIDRTKNRTSSFFGNGIVGHIAFGHPVCSQLAGILADAIASLELPDIALHRGGTYICMEGPAFSTQAESNLYRSGATVIGMTALPEAKLAREAEIAYATLALVTDYDCWHQSKEPVSVEAILSVMHANVAQAKTLLRDAIQRTGGARACPCATALRQTIVTAPKAVTASVKRRYGLFLKPAKTSNGRS